MSDSTNAGPEPQGTAILMVRGWTQRAQVSDGLKSLVRECFPDADEPMVPALDLGIFSTADPSELVQRIIQVVDERWATRPFERLIIIGVSAGTLLARNLYATACGAVAEPDRELDEGAAKPWAPRVARILLVAGVTRGWSVSSATPPLLRFLAPWFLAIVTRWARLARRRELFIKQLQRGAPFVIESRLKLFQVERHDRAAGTGHLPHTLLLLGSQDEYVSPADAIDLGPREGYSCIEVPYSNHLDLLDIGRMAGDDDTDAARLRRARAESLKRALLAETPADVADIAMHHEDIDDWLDEMDRSLVPLDSDADRQVGHVVFVVHGIRDNGFWTKRLARAIKELARRRAADAAPAEGRPSTLVVRVPSPSYGFFSLWDFVNPWGRETATRWFLEKYAEVKVRWPDARISYIGHSNGSYLAARALRDCPMVALRRVAFAGSVVRTDYPWHERGRQVESVLNLAASADWVVACLPWAFERLGLRGLDVGGAGFQGFSPPESVGAAAAEHPQVHNFCYVEGGHGAGIAEPMWPALAAYVVDGTIPSGPVQRTSNQEKWGQRAKWAPLAIAGVLVGGFMGLVALFDDFALALWAAVYVLLVNQIVLFF